MASLIYGMWSLVVGSRAFDGSADVTRRHAAVEAASRLLEKGATRHDVLD